MECSGSRMLSHIFFRNLFQIFTEFIGIVQRIPHLRKERIHLGSIAVVSASAIALVAPVTSLQDKTRAGSEFMSESALEFQLAAPVALVHFCAEQPAAEELHNLLHIRNVKFAFLFGFVIAVVYRNNCVPVREMLHFGELIRKRLPSFAAAPVGVDVILRVILYKV